VCPLFQTKVRRGVSAPSLLQELTDDVSTSGRGGSSPMPGAMLTIATGGRLVDSVSGTFTQLNHRHWELPTRPCQPSSSATPSRAVSPAPSTHHSEEDSSIEENIPELAVPLRRRRATNDDSTSVADPTTATRAPAQAMTSIPWNCLLDVCFDAAPAPPAPHHQKTSPVPPKPVSTVALKKGMPEADSVPVSSCTAGCMLAAAHAGHCTLQRISGKRQSRPSARLLESTAPPPPPSAAGSKRAVTPDENVSRGPPAVAAPTPPVKRRLAIADSDAHTRVALMSRACGDVSGMSPEAPRALPLCETQPGQL